MNGMKLALKAAVKGGRYAAAVAFTIAFSALAAVSQTPSNSTAVSAADVKNKQPTATAVNGPAMKAYRKLAIGMPADLVTSTWGKAKIEDKDGFLYELSDDQTAQLRLGADKKIYTIAVTFVEGKGAPTFTEVFGPGVVMPKQDDGSVYYMGRYPEQGYWISYYMGPGSDSVVTLTFQKI